ncbi:hypothetical protein BGX31_010052 [Mortierella sp. GBA43]|nr:hypothetical protein BGX31_010052 [Mortierella sp. GBA43]
MAVAIVAISQEHGYTKSQQGIILAAFFFGYILTPIIGGTLADRYGGKPILAVGNKPTDHRGRRSIEGKDPQADAGVAFPSIHSMIGVWIPPGERSKAVATVTGFGYMGTIISLPISSALVVSPWGWRGIFWLFGTLGLVWSATWQLFNSFGFFVMQTWAPTFYLDYYGVDIGKIGFYAVLPSAMQSAVGLTAGYLGDKAVQDWKWTTLRVRRLSQAVGSLGLGVFLILAVLLAPTAAVAMALITVGMALNGFTMTGASAYQHDFCPQYAGFIFSLGNTAGSIPAVIGVFLVGRLLEGGAGCWVLIWTVVCLFYVVGVTSFVLLSTDRRFPRTILTK